LWLFKKRFLKNPLGKTKVLILSDLERRYGQSLKTPGPGLETYLFAGEAAHCYLAHYSPPIAPVVKVGDRAMWDEYYPPGMSHPLGATGL
jgi:hypothetical protein